jgi:hypothetical protein
LRCGKKVEKLIYYCFSCSLFKNPITGGKMARRKRRGRRRKQLLYDVREKKRYWKLKEEALDVGSSLWKSLWICRKIRLNKE